MMDNWIDRKITPPKLEQDVLFFVKSKYEGEFMFVGSLWNDGSINITGASGREMEQDFNESEVTHWRELPPVPTV